jgi:hypothetical protein
LLTKDEARRIAEHRQAAEAFAQRLLRLDYPAVPAVRREGEEDCGNKSWRRRNLRSENSDDDVRGLLRSMSSFRVRRGWTNIVKPPELVARLRVADP